MLSSNHSIEHLKNQGVCWEKCLFAGFLCSFPGVFYDFGAVTSPTDLSIYANHADPGESCAGASLHGILFLIYYVTSPPFDFLFQAAGHLLYLYYRKQTLLYMKRFVIGILAHVDAGKTTMSEQFI